MRKKIASRLLFKKIFEFMNRKIIILYMEIELIKNTLKAFQ